MMRKIVSLILMLIFLLSLSFCSQESTPNSNSGGDNNNGGGSDGGGSDGGGSDGGGSDGGGSDGGGSDGGDHPVTPLMITDFTADVNGKHKITFKEYKGLIKVTYRADKYLFKHFHVKYNDKNIDQIFKKGLFLDIAPHSTKYINITYNQVEDINISDDQKIILRIYDSLGTKQAESLDEPLVPNSKLTGVLGIDKEKFPAIMTPENLNVEMHIIAFYKHNGLDSYTIYPSILIN